MNIPRINSYKKTNFSSKLDNNIRPDWSTRCRENPDEVVFLTKEEEQSELLRLKIALKNFAKDLFLKPQKNKSIEDESYIFPIEYEILNKLDKGNSEFTKEDYESLSPKALKIARSYSKPAKQIVKDNLFYSDLLKKELDERYGKNNYIFVSVGRSPSTVGRCLEEMEVPVIYCPISGLRYDELDKFRKSYRYTQYLDFLAQKGLSKEQVENSGKKLLVYDYTESGASLKCFGEILSKGMGLDENIIVLRSLNQDILDIAPNKYDASVYIGDMFSCCKAERYGGVPEWDLASFTNAKNAKLTPENQAGYNQFKFILYDKNAK